MVCGEGRASRETSVHFTMATIVSSSGSNLHPLKRLLGQGHECVPRPVGGAADHEAIGSEFGAVQVDLEAVHRVAMAVAPKGRGPLAAQFAEAMEAIHRLLLHEGVSMDVTYQTIFLRRGEDAAECERLMRRHFEDRMPATCMVVQPPCCGADLAIEAWAIGGRGTAVTFHNPWLVEVRYDELRWLYCAGIVPEAGADTAHAQSESVFRQMSDQLAAVDARFDEVVRTWLYFGGITSDEAGTERYRELNRARTEFFANLNFGGHLTLPGHSTDFFPASTGIGTCGLGLVTACQALQTNRSDVRLLPLENPLQTPSYQYGRQYSLKSPKFSRAMAVAIGGYVTTWVSGTASIVNSETVHPGDVAKQTHQTIDNIRNLIAPENFARQGMPGAGAGLKDLAKVRVYIKRKEDYEKCRAICDERLGGLPTIYAEADVCRPDLLVEIEGVAFSPLARVS